MKIGKILLAFIFSIAFLKVDAQWEKGSYLFGTGWDGDLSLGIPPKLNNSDGTIDFGYFIKNRWAIGTGLTINRGNRFNRSWLNYNVDVFSQYYFSVENRWSYYGEAFAGFGQRKYDFPDLGLKANDYKLTYGLGIGANYRVTKRMHFDVGTRYRVNEFFDGSGGFGLNNFSTRAGLKFNLFGKKK